MDTSKEKEKRDSDYSQSVLQSVEKSSDKRTLHSVECFEMYAEPAATEDLLKRSTESLLKLLL